MILLTPIEIAVRTWMQGAIAMGYLVVAFFFLSFWRETRQRLFIYFAVGFLTLSVHRTIFALTFGERGWDEFSFALRLLGYLLILAGVVDTRLRNRSMAEDTTSGRSA